jgi:hypothetical protein
MHLVDEQDDLAMGAGDFIEHRFQTLLEIAAEFGAGDQRAHVQRHQFAVAQAFGHVAIDDAQRQAFGDGRLAYARLADQHRIVLGAAGQNLDGAADFLVAADHRIKLAVAGKFGEVAGIFLQRVIGILGRGAVGGAALAQTGNCGVQPLGGDAGVFQDFRRVGTGGEHQRQQQIFGGDKAVAGFFGDLFGIVQQPGGVLRQVNLARTALHFRQLLERCFRGGAHLAVASSRGGNQAGRQAFLVVEKDLEKVFGDKLLIAFAKGEALGGLNETARPLGEFLDIHALSRSAPFLMVAQATAWLTPCLPDAPSVGSGPLYGPGMGAACLGIWDGGTGPARAIQSKRLRVRPNSKRSSGPFCHEPEKGEPPVEVRPGE